MKPHDPIPGTDAKLHSLLKLLQLASPALPVGGFAYSQGLEKAIEDSLVHNAATTQRWIADCLLLSLARWEAPLWLRAFDAYLAADTQRFAQWNQDLFAARETAELRAETLQMGTSLLRVLPMLGVTPPTTERITYPAAFAAACAALHVEREAGLAAYLWSWLENQVLVAVKTVPLGQQAGQQMLFTLHGALAQAVAIAAALKDDELGSAAVQFALISARHETQYSRLYRS